LDFDENIYTTNFIFSFYTECLLPEIVNPQYGKRLLVDDIIDPEHILENIKKKKSKILK